MFKKSISHPLKFSGRNRSGVAPLEVAITAFLMIIVSGLTVDLALLLFGAAANDACCRDACRAAGQQSSSSAALSAAQSMLTVHATDGYFLSQPTLVSTTSPDFVYQNYSGAPPSTMSPYVTVSTQITVRLPCPLFWHGTSFNGGSSFLFQRQYTFPIVNTTLTN